MTTEREPTTERDAGVAMILAIAWGMGLLALALIVSQAAIRQIQPSGRGEDSAAALAAAEAGVDDYRARLVQAPTYYANDDPDNAALGGWTPVPGGSTDAEFTYAIDASRAGVGGEVRVISSGRSGGVTRTVETILSKRSTLDYVYMSDIETPSADLPGAYSTAANSGGNGLTAQQLARLLCTRRFYEAGQVSPAAVVPLNGIMRNLRFCQWAGIYNEERLVGRLHTNDVWRLEATSLTGTLDANSITSSCPSTAEGLLPGQRGCSATHRYLETSYGYSNNGNNATWNTSNTYYQGDAANPASGTERTNRNPTYDTVLDLPPSPATLKARASELGCVFTGPTRIRFAQESGVGVMYVTSPDTKVTAPACDGSDGTAYAASTATNQVTRRIVLTDLAGIVIYVQNVRRSTEADDPDNAWDLVNRWTAGTEPSCQAKTAGRTYPFVIPNPATDTAEAAFFTTGSTYRGYPSELANPASPWYGSSCASGDLYVQGSFRGQLTLATENNVILTSSLIDAQQVSGTTTGQPSPESQSTIGVVSSKFTYLYRPFNASNAWVADWRQTNALDVKFNFAVLAIDQCLAAQDPYFGPRNGNLYLWGSLAQKYRCVVGSTGGYNKQYRYDARLARRTPPYMLELSDEPWTIDRTGEVTPLRQGVGAADWPLLYSDDSGTTISNVAVEAGPATVTTVGTSARVTATAPGLVIVTYTATTGGLADYRRLVIEVQ